jgi:hypothetical protein
VARVETCPTCFDKFKFSGKSKGKSVALLKKAQKENIIFVKRNADANINISE